MEEKRGFLSEMEELASRGAPASRGQHPQTRVRKREEREIDAVAPYELFTT